VFGLVQGIVWCEKVFSVFILLAFFQVFMFLLFGFLFLYELLETENKVETENNMRKRSFRHECDLPNYERGSLNTDWTVL